ncbi:DUF2341 domain-containing protein [Patescibacteria group bacterium]
MNSSKQKRIIKKRRVLFVTVFSVAIVGLVIIGVQSVHFSAKAQSFNPSSAPPLNPGDPNMNPPLYAGDAAAYGGAPQARLGPLTIGEVYPSLGTEELYVKGSSEITEHLDVGPVASTFGEDGIIIGHEYSTYGDGQYEDVAIDSTYLYTVGMTKKPLTGSDTWILTKRRLSDGSLCTDANPCDGTGFGYNEDVYTGNGIVNENISDFDTAFGVAVDSNYIYVVGEYSFSVQKRRKSDGSLCTDANPCDGSGFGTDMQYISGEWTEVYDGNGTIDATTGTDPAYAIAIDEAGGYMYVAGMERVDSIYRWRIDKRRLLDGRLCRDTDPDPCTGGGFGYDENNLYTGKGFVTGAIPSYQAKDIKIDATEGYMYIVGYKTGPYDWRIEKRSLIDGALDTTFDGDGILEADGATRMAEAVALDDTYMYIVGHNENYDWRIEKRSRADGILDVNFGYDCSTGSCNFSGDGVVTGDSAPFATTYANDIAIDTTFNYMYVVGSPWRVEKRYLFDGALVDGFGTGGVVTSSWPILTANAVALDKYFLYIVGLGLPANYDGVLEKRRIGTGEYSQVPPSIISALADNKHAVYGETTDNSFAGVYGTTTAVGGAAIISSDSAIDGVSSIYGEGQGAMNYGIYGLNPVGWAGYFDGNVEVARGEFFAETATFNGPQAIQGDLTIDGTLNGWTLDAVNALSIQDQRSVDPPTEAGIRSMVLTTNDAECTKLSDGSACGGSIPAGDTAEWKLGTSGGTGDINNHMVIDSFTVQYSDDGERTFKKLEDADQEYQHCNGSSLVGTMKAANTYAVPYQFRVVVFYKEYDSQQSPCGAYDYKRQLTIPASDEGDSMKLFLDNTTSPTANDIFTKSTSAIPGDDVRIFYTTTDLDRDIVTFTASEIEIWFKVQADIAAPDSTNYFLYYGDAAAVNPPADKDNIYLLWDDFNDGSIDPAKWGTDTRPGCGGPGEGTVVKEELGELIIDFVSSSYCWSGGWAYSANEFDTTGKYVIEYTWFPDNTWSGGNDGFYIRNPVVFRNESGSAYGGTNEKAVYIGYGRHCGYYWGGITLHSYGPRADTLSHCPWGNLINAWSPNLHTEGAPYPIRIKLDTEYVGAGELGFVEVEEPPDTLRVSGGVLNADFSSIGPTFVVEMFNPGFGGAAGGSSTEKFDDFILRRGKTEYDPEVSAIGPEI